VADNPIGYGDTVARSGLDLDPRSFSDLTAESSFRVLWAAGPISIASPVLSEFLKK